MADRPTTVSPPHSSHRAPSVVLVLALLLSTGALLGVSTILGKVAVGYGLTAHAFLLLSVTGAVPILFLHAWFRGLQPLRRDRLRYAFISGLLGIAAPNLLLFSALPALGSGFVALLLSLPPVLTYFAAVLLRMDGASWPRGLGVASALAGTAWLALIKVSEPAVPLGWLAVALCAPFFLAGGNIYRSRYWPAGATPGELAPTMMVMAAAILLAVTLVPSTATSLHLPLSGPGPSLVIAAQAFAFSIQYLLFFRLQKIGGPVALSLIGSVAASTAVPLAVVLFGEPWPGGILTGALLILCGILLVIMPGRPPRLP